MKRGPELLDHYEDNWETDIGAWFPGERVVFQGHDLLNELASWDWFDLLIFGLTGRQLGKAEITLISKVFLLASSFPEPRLWNNRIAALGATAKSTGSLSISAANAVSEATVFGGRPVIKSMDMIMRSLEATKADICLDQFLLDELKDQRVLSGYGRPVVRADERIQPLLREASKLGLAEGAHTTRALEIANNPVLKRYRLSINVAALAAGLVADIGLTPREYYYISCFSFLAGIAPCYIGTAKEPEGTFFPLACDRIDCVDKKEIRLWMRAE